MTYIKINDNLIEATIRGFTTDREWDNRESKAITMEMSYDETIALFTNNVKWSIVYQAAEYVNEEGKTVKPEPVEYDNSDYCISGAITDNRDGTITIKMGKLTDLEETLILLYGGIA